MNDISYEILDLFKKYGADKEGILKILEADSRPEVLYALSDIRRNLMDWMDFSGQEHVLQLGSDYGVITGLLAERCASVAVVDERDENLVVNQKMNEAHTNISYMKAADFQKMEAVEKEGKYDLVVLRADRPDMDIKECFTRLSSYLSENGKLIFACENALGLNFLSGAVHDEDETAFTKGELEEALKEAGLSKVEFYYPMPEYKRAVSVYSDRYLPCVRCICRGRILCDHHQQPYGTVDRKGDNSCSIWKGGHQGWQIKTRKNQAIHWCMIPLRLP